jgi:hypothetical protein
LTYYCTHELSPARHFAIPLSIECARGVSKKDDSSLP